MPESPISIFAKNLRKLRRKKYSNGDELAKKLGIPTTTYYSYEQARAFPDLEVIIGIVKELKITYNELFEPFLVEYPVDSEFQELYKKFELIKNDPRSVEILKKLLEIIDIWTGDIEKRRA